MAELYGRVGGVSKGWGGSMHMFDSAHRLLGGDEIVMCTMGDGTTNIGAFHESLNIADLWNLSIVYVIVKNRFGMGTTVEKSSAEPELYKRGAAYRIKSARVDGLEVVCKRLRAAPWSNRRNAARPRRSSSSRAPTRSPRDCSPSSVSSACVAPPSPRRS